MYEDKTPEAIKAEILAAIRQSQGLSAMAGGFADGVAGPVAEQLSEAYRALEGVTSMLFVDESSGGYIDLVGGQYYNITRREGTRAYCDISFSGTPGLVIPKGTAFLTAGGLSYALMAAVALGPEGTGRGRLEAAEAGSAYNVEAGAIDRMYVNLTGLTDYHSEAAAGGTDAESDAALLARVRERVQRPPTSGNGYQYRQWAMEVAGVGSAKVVELPGGPGTVGVTLVDSNDRAPSEEIVEAVTAHIEEERPIGAAVTVTAAGEREVTVAAQVSLTGGAGAGAVQDAFRAALAGYLHTLIEGKYGAVYYKPADDQPYTLLYNRVLALLLNVEGVENFASLTVNGGTADVTIQAACRATTRTAHRCPSWSGCWGSRPGRCACPSRTHWPSSGWTPPPGGWTCGSSGWGCPPTALGPTATGGAASRPSSGARAPPRRRCCAAWWPPLASSRPRFRSSSTRRSINSRSSCPIWPPCRRM